MALLNTERFKTVTTDPIAATKREMQKIFFEKSNFSNNELYPKGLTPTRFYVTTKVHKLKYNRRIDELLIQCIICSINKASYQLTKYLDKLLWPLNTSECTVESTNEIITHIKEENIPNNFKLWSSDGASLFTNVPLAVMADVILKRI